MGRHRLSKLESTDVDAFMASKLADYSANSQRIMRSTLRKAIHDAQRARCVPTNVVDLSEPVKVSRRAKAWLDIPQARKLLASLKGDRLEALWILLLSLGLRRGEGLGLKWEDIDLKGGTIIIRRSLKRVRRELLPDGSASEGPKTRLVFGSTETEKSWRTQNLPKPAIAALRRHKKSQAKERLAASSWGDEGLVFTTPLGTPIDPDNLAKRFVTLCEAAGLGHRNLHQLRHSAVTIMLAQGVPLHEVSEVVGHTSLTVTKDIYRAYHA